MPRFGTLHTLPPVGDELAATAGLEVHPTLMSSAATQKKPPRRVIEFDEASMERDAETALGGIFSLDPSEIRWRDRQPELEKRGYNHRARYSPDWKPSWLGTDANPFFCEDGIIGLVRLTFESQEFTLLMLSLYRTLISWTQGGAATGNG